MVEGLVTQTGTVNEGINDRAGVVNGGRPGEGGRVEFDLNHFVEQIKSNHPSFLGPDVRITFFKD